MASGSPGVLIAGAVYLLAGLAYALRWRPATWLAAAGSALLLGALAARGLQAGHWPLTSGYEFGLAFALGTPFAYLLARKEFKGKKLIESVVDLPIMIPHPVVGIALLSIAGLIAWLSAMMLAIAGPLFGIHVPPLLIVGMVVFSGAFSVLSLPRLVGLGRQPKNGQQRHV